jgi:hypothetical protein
MEYKESKWAKKIIELQKNDGSWGYFHSLSVLAPKQSITTEQALRRLKILGYTLEDKPIKKAISYLQNCLSGKITIPDRVEKLHNWKIFTELMYSTWIRIFTLEDKKANEIVKKWSIIINTSFENGKYDNAKYISTYEKILEWKPKGGRLLDFNNFYQVSLLTNCLERTIEPVYFKYILDHDSGMYYIYGKKISLVPEVFKTKEASKYISAIEILAEYKNCRKQLDFVVKWLKNNMENGNTWDMGNKSKDGIYFPLSDSWKKEEYRVNDCTNRINKLIKNIGV